MTPIESPRQAASAPAVAPQPFDPAELLAHVQRVKAAWRAHEKAMTWEEKVAAIERMRERSQQLARARAKVQKQ
jgi:hypothetical protein